MGKNRNNQLANFVLNTDFAKKKIPTIKIVLLICFQLGRCNLSKGFANYIKGALGIFLLTIVFILPREIKPADALTPIEQLGKSLFFDENLSLNSNQSCATCHDPSTGYTGPMSEINAHGAIYPGSDASKFGKRKPATVAYSGNSPVLQYSDKAQAWIGGMFWDGHATGKKLGDPLAEQAKESFINPLEMALASPVELCNRVANGKYIDLYEQVWGKNSLNCANTGKVYDQIGQSIAAYERSIEVSPYTSKFDQFWNKTWDKRLNVREIGINNWKKYRNSGLTDTELYGLAVFNDPNGANCASCHLLKPGPMGYPLFTNYRYANLGTPRNLENPFYVALDYNPAGEDWVDNGLGGYLENGHPKNAAQEMGKMKVPTLRNVDKRPSADFIKAYGHNGYFKSLDEIILFHASSRTSCGEMDFPPPEVNQNIAVINPLNCSDVTYIVSFLKTLSDGYFQR
jgi:cytochrome c peroxidase